MRKAAFILGLGAFLVTMALLLKFYAYPKLAVVPLDQNVQQVARDANATFFDADHVRPGSGAIATRITVIADKKASEEVSEQTGRNVVVMNYGRFTDNNNEPPPMEAFRDRIAIDRYTGETVRWDGDIVEGKAGHHEGLTIKFPFQTKKQTYQFWDNRTAKAVPVTYAGTDTIKGMKVYKFQDVVPKTEYMTQEVPRGIFGLPDTGGVVAKRFYTNNRTIWVEPETGVMVKVQENRRDTIELDQPGAKPVTAISTTSTFDDQTVSHNVDEYKTKAGQLKILRFWAPLAMAILGLLLLLTGLAVSAGASRRAREAEEDEDEQLADVDEFLGSTRQRPAGGQV